MPRIPTMEAAERRMRALAEYVEASRGAEDLGLNLLQELSLIARENPGLAQIALRLLRSLGQEPIPEKAAILCLDIPEIGKLCYDRHTRVAISPLKPGEEIRLSEKKRGVLETLLETPEAIVSKETFLRRVWGLTDTTDVKKYGNYVVLHVNYLRNDLGSTPERELIHTYWGEGYSLTSRSFNAYGRHRN